MTEHEKYKRMFSVIRPSTNVNLEVIRMDMNKKSKKGLIATCATLAFVGATSVAYATDFAGVRQAIRAWIHGEEKNIILEELEPGHFSWHSEDGESGSVGGLVYDGLEDPKPIAAEDVKDELESPYVYVDGNGITWLCYKDQKVDISEQIANNNGTARVEMEDEGRTMYVTVRIDENGGSNISSNYTGFDD